MSSEPHLSGSAKEPVGLNRKTNAKNKNDLGGLDLGRSERPSSVVPDGLILNRDMPQFKGWLEGIAHLTDPLTDSKTFFLGSLLNLHRSQSCTP